MAQQDGQRFRFFAVVQSHDDGHVDSFGTATFPFYSVTGQESGPGQAGGTQRQRDGETRGGDKGTGDRRQGTAQQRRGARCWKGQRAAARIAATCFGGGNPTSNLPSQSQRPALV